MSTLRLNTHITMRESARWISTATAPTVAATVTGKRPNAMGGITYTLEFTSNKLLNGKRVQVTRLLTDRELLERGAQVVRKARKQQPSTDKRTGRAA